MHFYRRIAEAAPPFLKPDGLVAVEMGYDQSRSVQEIFLGTGKYERTEVRKDLAGIDRVAAFYKRREVPNV